MDVNLMYPAKINESIVLNLQGALNARMLDGGEACFQTANLGRLTTSPPTSIL